MAHQNFDGPYSLPAAADLSTNQYQFVVINGSGKIALCGAGLRARGILDNLPKQDEMARFFSHHGVAMKIRCGAVAIAAYAKVASDATGKAITGVTGNYGMGLALEAAAPGDIFTLWYDPEGILP